MTSSSASSSDFARRFVCSSLSVAVATAATNPIDVVKVNLQMHKTSSVNVPSVATATPIATASTSAAPIATAPLARPRPGPSSFGFIGTATHLFRNEGMWAFTKGMEAALVRSVVYGGVRIGCYNPLKQAFGVTTTTTTTTTTTAGPDDTNKPRKTKPGVISMMAAGISAGAIATAVSNPLDLIKTRQQAPPANSQTPYAKPTMLSIARNEGVLALWKGVVPAAVRASVLTASQCVTYDIVKDFLMHGLEDNVIVRNLGLSPANNTGGFVCVRNMEDGLPTHVSTSMITGLVSTTLTNPVDVVKTRMFVEGGNGLFSVIGGIYSREGVRGFLKGWTANYVRLGPQTMLIFVVFENLKWVFGIDSL